MHTCTTFREIILSHTGLHSLDDTMHLENPLNSKDAILDEIFEL